MCRLKGVDQDYIRTNGEKVKGLWEETFLGGVEVMKRSINTLKPGR